MNEEEFDITKIKQLLLFPGMLAPVQLLHPLVRYLRANQSAYGVTSIPLGQSLSDFNSIVDKATDIITKKLLQKSTPGAILLFGHSHGGRVAWEVARKLQNDYPSVEYSIITAGTPMLHHPDYLPWYQERLFRLSKAYRDWPKIVQPDSTLIKKYIGYYSTNDKTVIPEFAKEGHGGELIELEGLSHHDLISPKKMGPRLLAQMD
jgi:hypothetical protein